MSLNMRLIGRHPPTPREIWAVIILAPGDSSHPAHVQYTVITRQVDSDNDKKERFLKQTLHCKLYIS